ncbi:MAG TPA: flagellin [Caulobacteraceae bacterium]|jgi:flagellar hook-associated protein 3 FlgL
MDRVSTSFAMKMATGDFLRAQIRQVEAQNHVSTGKKATDLKGFGRDATTLTAARTVQARVDAFIDNSHVLVGRLEAQNLSLDRYRQVVDSAKSSVASSIAAGRADTMMIELNGWFGQASQSLNTKHEGASLFAGGLIDRRPVEVDDLTELAGLPAVANAFHNDDSVPTSRLDESTVAVSGFLASDVGTEFFGIMREIQEYHTGVNGPLNSTLNPTQTAFLQDKLAQLGVAHDNATRVAAQNGLIQRRVDDAVTAQEARAVTLKGFISGVAEVDMAEALSRLQQAQVGLQASAYAINALKSSSLLNLLEP